MKDTEEIFFKEAMKRIGDLVEEVFIICEDVANDNDYDREWVLDRFREEFNKAKRKINN